MTIFELTRLRRIELIALYLASCDGWLAHGGNRSTVIPYVASMSREQLVAKIAATRKGARLLGRAA